MPGRDIDATMITIELKRPAVFLLFFLVAGIPALFSVSTSTLDQEKADKMAKTLINAQTPADSIRILYDVYDLSDRDKRKDVGLQILDIAQRNNDEKVIIDLLGRLSNKVEDIDALQRLLEISQNLSNDSASKTATLILKIEEANKLAGSYADTTKERKIIEYAATDRFNTQDIYEETIDLYRTIINIQGISQGSLFLEYLTRFGDLVNQLPQDDFYLRNLYYSTAAIYYTRKRDYDRAIDADRKLLALMDEFEQKFRDSGRKFYNFDYIRYVSYRRLLANYKGLPKEEVENIYALCQKLAENNEEVAETFGKHGLSKSYYYIATERYPEAMVTIKQALEVPDLSDFRKMALLEMLADASRHTGDKETELTALRQYNDMLNADRKKRSEDAYKELEIRREINKLALQDYRDQEKIHEENRKMRRISLTLVYVFALILIFQCRAYFRLKQKMKILETKNNKLRNNLEYIFDDGRPKGSSDLRKQKKDRLKG